MTSRSLAALAAILVLGPGFQTPARRYVFLWAGDADRKDSDFLAVWDVGPGSPTYGNVIATVPVGDTGTRPHHTDYELPANNELWANGFAAGKTYRFDVGDPLHPKLVASFGNRGPYQHPHSYLHEPGGRVLGAFQATAENQHSTGGLVEMDSAGNVLRSSSAAVDGDSGIRPYSLIVIPALDRIVTTATDMHLMTRSSAVQIWRRSDLKLLHTIYLPEGPRGGEHQMTAEPRLLADGRTVMVNTFQCGLYLLDGVATETPSARWVLSAPFTDRPFCAVPVVIGNFWIQPNGPERAVVSLDVSDPAKPREVSRLTLGAEEIPHWLAVEPGGDRLVLTGYGQLESRALLLHVNRTTGALTLDSLRLNLDRPEWPHGATGRAIPHGAVFSRP